MLSLIFATTFGLSQASQAIDEITTVSRSSLPAKDQVVTTAGKCGDIPVSVSVSNHTGEIEVQYADKRSVISPNDFSLNTQSRDRNVARTFLTCRAAATGGLTVNFIVVEPKAAASQWMVRGFSVASDLSFVSAQEDSPLDEEPVEAFD